MSRSYKFLLLGLAACSASACSQHSSQAWRNTTPYSVHQPVVQRTDYVLDINASGGLPAVEAGRLRGWFDMLGLGYGDRVSIDPNNGYLHPAVRAGVAGVAADYGILLEDGAPVTDGTVQPGTARVVVSRLSASVQGCPDWRDAADMGARNGTSSNFGCSINSNLAAMVADPGDLVLGQDGTTVGDAEAAAKAVKAYRDRTQTGNGGTTLKSESVGK